MQRIGAPPIHSIMGTKIVNLIEPELCNECQFKGKALVTLANGLRGPIMFCHRRDCDNWQVTDSEPVSNVEILEK